MLPAGTLSRTEQPVLRTPTGLTLRPWLPRDAPVVVRAYSDPDIRHWHGRSMVDEDEAGAWIAGLAHGWSTETDAGWAIVRGDTVVGRTVLRDLDLAGGVAELGYWTLPEHRRTGTAVQAGRAALRWAFEVGFHRVELFHSTRNPPSCRVATKLGMGLEGTLRDALQHVDGWHDMHVHAVVGAGAST